MNPLASRAQQRLDRLLRAGGGHPSAVLLLVCAALAVYGHLLDPTIAPYSPHSDIPARHLAWKQILFASLRAGHGLPLWYDDQFAGQAVLTQPQALYFHPLQLLFYWLPPERAFGPTLVLMLFAGALGAYVWARQRAHSWALCVLCGIAQLTCFKLVIAAYAGWSSVLATLVVLPWLAAAWQRSCERPGLASLLALALVLTCIVLGGLPQTPYYAIVCLGGMALIAPGAHSLGPRVRRALRVTGIALCALGLALSCSALQWLPLVAEWRWLARSQQSYDFFLSGHALSPLHLATLIDPELFGTPLRPGSGARELWEDVAYFGRIPLLGVLVALLHPRALARSERYLLGAWLFSLAASLDSPLLRALYTALPGYAVFRLPGRMLFISALLGIALGMIGVRIASTSLERHVGARARTLLLVALGAAMLVEGGLYARRYIPTSPASSLRLPADHPVRALAAENRPRVAVVGRGTFNYGWAADAGISLVNGYDPYNYAHYKRFVALAETGEARGSHPGNWIDFNEMARPDLLDELSVEWLLSRAPLSSGRWQQVGHWSSVTNFTLYKGLRRTPLYLYRNPNARPRARFAQDVVVLPSLDAVEQRMAREPLRGQAYLVGDPTPAPAPTAPAGEPAAIEVRAVHPGHLELRTRSSAPQLLVLAEDYHPGWRATVDAQPRPILQTNVTLLGLFVPKGEHQIVVSFEPLAFRPACLASALGVLTLLILTGTWLHARRQPRPR